MVVSETTYQLGCTSIDFPELIQGKMHRTPLNIWIVNPWFLANFFKRPSDRYLSEQFNAVGLGRSGRYLGHNIWLLINIETESPSFIDSPSEKKSEKFPISLCEAPRPRSFGRSMLPRSPSGCGEPFWIILWLDHEDRTYLYITCIYI